ncbi:MAG TPA: DUF305 domain-containing protein [Gemmatimonadaceae bacterium]|jgi:uncharacterized protein (DUF305 family)|nr:DUF305 domain-containing protein [Gemmatimonadaceae bacterium]
MSLVRPRFVTPLVALATWVALIPAAQAQATESAARRQSDMAAIARAHADSLVHPYTQADIDFMAGMIHHHAQAIVMAKWAPTHDASPAVRTLCERIINAQRDEIGTMQQWLADRRQPVPPADTLYHDMAMGDMPGMEHMTLMPGMLSPEQMRQLHDARGKEFDRLFLTFMIQHHQGAVSMVKKLFDSYGAGQDELVFKLASDINVDQTTEIARMQRMLFSVIVSADSL